MTDPRPALLRVHIASGVALVGSLVALFSNARHYYPFISDDAFISLRYAERLLQGRGLTWTDGPPVEGYTNLLWTLLCAALGAVGVDLVLAARILGFLGMAAVPAAILWAVRPKRMVEVAVALVGMLGFALSGPAGVWVVGGLEQPLVAGLLAWALVACVPLLGPEPVTRRQILVPGVLLALLTLTRADGPVLVAAACLSLVLVHRLGRVGWQRGFLLAALPLAAFLGQLAFRVLYYDAWIPNTALVKVAFTVERLRTGVEYVLRAAGATALVLALGALPVLAGVRQRGPRWQQACFVWIVGLVWAGYVLFIGGDIFPAHRHWIATLVPACMAAALGLCGLAEHRPRVGWGSVAVGMAAVAVFAVQQPRDRENHRAVTERWEYNGEVVGRLLHRAFGDRQPLLAAAAVGAICYHAKLPSLDMLGLNDRHIARRRPKDFGTGFIGHELGDGAYAMSRQPDLVVFCGPTGRLKPCSRGEEEMMAMPEFDQTYQMVYFRGTDPFEVVARIWVRRYGKIGIEVSDDMVAVPGHLLSGGREARAELDENGQLGLRLPARGTAQVELPLPAGRWRLASMASDSLDITLTRVDNQGAAQRIEAEPFTIDGAPGSTASVRIRVKARGSAPVPVHIRQLVLTREP
jgi:hypothetical protein